MCDRAAQTMAILLGWEHPMTLRFSRPEQRDVVVAIAGSQLAKNNPTRPSNRNFQSKRQFIALTRASKVVTLFLWRQATAPIGTDRDNGRMCQICPDAMAAKSTLKLIPVTSLGSR